MELYVIRHADAVPLGEQGITSDEERCLSEAGVAQCRTLAKCLQKRDVEFDLIVTSPLVRARQTVDETLKHWSAAVPEVQECAALAPGGKKKRLARFLRDTGKDRVAVVGHEPDLSAFIGWLIGGKRSGIELAKAGVAYLSLANGARKGEGSLVWLVTPEWQG